MDDFSGWIKLHRNILQWEWWDDRNTRDLFLVALLLANHKEKKMAWRFSSFWEFYNLTNITIIYIWIKHTRG